MITFSGPKEAPYGCLHNFAGYQVRLYGMLFETSEHAYQALKFHPDEAVMHVIRDTLSPKAAAIAGRDPSLTVRPDWEKPPQAYAPIPIDDGLDRKGFVPEPIFSRLKDVVMYEVCSAKALQHESIQKVLLSTGDQPIVEDSARDPYWGWGLAQVGQNKLGRIWMLIRKDFQSALETMAR